jgi:hypothetical protein
MNNPTDAELSRAVCEKKGEAYMREDTHYTVKYRNYATDWSLIGPEIEKRFNDPMFAARIHEFSDLGETLPRAACLAILEE